MYRRYNITALILYILFVLLIPLLIASERNKKTQIPDFSRVMNYLDKPLTGQSYCDYTQVTDGHIDCGVYDEDTYVSYNVWSHSVTEASKIIYEPLPIGNLVIVWGDPDGMMKSGTGVYVTWSKIRSAAYMNAPSNSLSPSTNVGFVTFWSASTPRSYEPWYGFTHRNRNNGR